MGTHSPGRAGIDDPGLALPVDDQRVTVAVDDGAGAREALPQEAVAARGRKLVAMDDRQHPARQTQLQDLGQMTQGGRLIGWPRVGAVVVTVDGEDPPARLQGGQDGQVADVATVDGEVAAGHQLGDPWVERPVGIRN